MNDATLVTTIQAVYAKSASFAERAVLAKEMGSESASTMLLGKANTLAAAVQVLEQELGRKVCSPALVQPGIPAVTIANDIAAVSGATWCAQCDVMVTSAKAGHCRSRFCSVRP